MFNRELIKKLRLNAGLSQTYLANKLGITQGTYRGYEEGLISIERLMDIAQFYNVPISSFFEGDSAQDTELCRVSRQPEQPEVKKPDAPLCTVSITINVSTDKDKAKVSEILQMLK